MKKDHLRALRSQFEENLRLAILEMGEKSLLRDACEYALMNGGKRLRPLIVMLVADALGYGLDVSYVSLGVEYFHTSSLIADDLPCMDDDDERRAKPSLHKAFPESVALLASYSLIAAGYETIALNSQVMKKSPSFSSQSEKAAILGLQEASLAGGLLGATHGQFLDLFPTDSSLETILKIMKQKTVTLFQLSFVLGWLFGGGDQSQISDVKKCASHMGLAFQIADDLQDYAQDEKQQSEINIVKACGYEESSHLFLKEMEQFESSLKALGLWTPLFKELYTLLSAVFSPV